MAEISIGGAVGAGFGLIRRRPGSVLLWGLVQTVMLGLIFVLLMPMYGMVFAQMAAAKLGTHAAAPDIAAMLPYQLLSYLLNFLSIFVVSILHCAIFRCVILPDRASFASLRLGATEVLFALLMIGAYIVFFIALLIVIVPVAIIIGVLSAVHAVAIAVIVGVLSAVAAVWSMIYVMLRLSMVGPMMVEDGKVHITDAWAMTKGKVGSLFLIALCLVGIIIVGELVVVGLLSAIGFGVLGAIAGGAQAIPSLFKQSFPTLVSSLTPLIAIVGLALIPIYGAVLAIMGAPWARAYLDLRHNPAEAF